MINSLTDTDYYKLTMMQVVLHQYAGAHVRYAFKWRNWKEMRLKTSVDDFVVQLKKHIKNLCKLRFSGPELQYISGISYFKSDFIEYLRLFQLNKDFIHVRRTDSDEVEIIVEGPWLNTILFEVPVLAIVSELYTELNGACATNAITKGREKLKEKVSWLDSALPPYQKINFADFGTRRRASLEWHREVLQYLKTHTRGRLVGTSNVMLAMELGLSPIGTMAHEYLQAHQQLGPRLVDSQAAALQSWANEYRGELGIALSDVLGFRAFLKDFDRYFALLFDGCRHDSGDPVWWCENLIRHYKQFRINPMTKTAVFSDGLTFPIAVDLFRRFHAQIKTSFCIGTYFTNDCGFTAPQVVMKLVGLNGKPTAKVSDSPGKCMCEDPEFLDYMIKVIREKVNGE